MIVWHRFYWLLQEESNEILTAAGSGESATLLHLSSKGVDITAAENEVAYHYHGVQ